MSVQIEKGKMKIGKGELKIGRKVCFSLVGWDYCRTFAAEN